MKVESQVCEEEEQANEGMVTKVKGRFKVSGEEVPQQVCTQPAAFKLDWC